jgi:simple sugar transport system ATP-binding protein
MHLQMSGLSKRFGDRCAVEDVDFEARAGEVTALLGENGAGKSTLMKLLYGIHRPDAGRIALDGETVDIASPRDAVARGIGMVFQQFSLIPSLSVRENLALSLPRAPWWLGRGARRVDEPTAALRSVAPEIDPDRLIAELSVGQMQLVELAKVLMQGARLVILDEPSAVLTPAEAARLWQLVRGWCAQGGSVVLITHKLADVHACADRVVVMRAGRRVGDVGARGLDDAQVVRLMVGGREIAATTRTTLAEGACSRLWIRDAVADGLHRLSLELKTGEVLAVAGVSGNGQTALAEVVAGMRDLQSGEVILDGAALRAPGGVRSNDAPRIGYIPEQPLRNAVAPELSLSVNLLLGRIASLPFFPPHAALQDEAAALLAAHDVRPGDPALPARALSGGNLQKLVVARELAGQPPLIVACYPTMGLDVAATAQIYRALFGCAQAGSAVLWISEDLDDMLAHAHRVAVMLDGRVVQVLDAATTTVETLGAWMSGVQPGSPAPTPAMEAVTA